MMTMMIMMTMISLRKMDLYRADFKLCLFSRFSWSSILFNLRRTKNENSLYCLNRATLWDGIFAGVNSFWFVQR